MHSRRVRLVAFLTVLACSCFPALAQNVGFKNPDFAADTIGQPPDSWFVIPAGNAEVVDDPESPTGRSLKIGPAPGGTQTVVLRQSIDARPFRGKRVIVRADVRLAPHDSTTQLRNAQCQAWVRVDRENDQTGFFDNMADRPIKGLRALRFQTYSLSGVVDADAVSVTVGLMTHEKAVAHLARVRIDTVDPGVDPNVPARALSDRGLTNLVVLARLYGYVRYFHPSDQAADAAWEPFLIAAAEQVEPAADAATLAAKLNELFAPLAPTIIVWAGDQSAAPAPPAPALDSNAAYTFWKHHGVDTGAQSPAFPIYTSRRQSAAVDHVKDGNLAPGASTVKQLADGVWCRVPLTVYTDSSGASIPKADGHAAIPARPEWWSPNGKDRSSRLAGVMIAWNVFQHFYPYFDICDADWPAALTTALRTAAADADDVAYLRTLQHLVAELDDGHGSVAPLNMSRPGQLDAVFDWVGAARDTLVVAKVGPGVKDMQPGDVVVKVGDTPTDEWYRECRTRISAATEQWARWRACSDHSFFGWNNDPVSFTLQRDGREFTLSLPRLTNNSTLKEDRPADASEVAPGIVYFNLDGAEAPAWQAALPKLDAARGVILDLRGYPGGAGMQMLRHLTDKRIQSAKWLIPDSLLPDRESVVMSESQRWNLPFAEPRLGDDGQKVAIITDGRAISYAESCMGIVEAYKLAEIVGGLTAGTNGNINPFSVCGGYYIVWTGMRVVKHDDSPHHGVGIAPTVPASRTVEGIRAGRDELLEAAIKAVSPG